ncbi:MAG TPA: PaaI family thioesterase [Thermoanaerobaculia bacterium]|nr:PaaI family thioesterase [Thermoanaerobaculia bacterium]
MISNNRPFQPQDPDFAERVRASFARQPFMATLGARLARVASGEVDIELPFRGELTQQHGFMHAGVVTAIADTACGYAAYTLMPADAGVLSVEFKINLVAPAAGDTMIARGRVTRPGRTLTVCAGEVWAATGGEETLVAALLGTMMAVRGRLGIAG